MNERIKLLAEQARKEYLKLPTGYRPEQVGMYRELMKKFAELIVRECAKVADIADENKCEWIGGNILTHFGVEA